MNFRGIYESRERRNILAHSMTFANMPYNIAKYSTESTEKREFKFDSDYLNKIQSMPPDPLRKNLADSIISQDKKTTKMTKTTSTNDDFYYPHDFEPEKPKPPEPKAYPSMTGIANFFTTVFGAISGAMFKRPKSPDIQYYDCIDDSQCFHEMAPSWQPSNMNGLNKTSASSSELDMSDYHAAVAQCESKLNAVRNLLTSEPLSRPPKATKTRLRRPRRVFVDPGSVHSSYDEYATEEYVSLANDEYIEYFGARSNVVSDNCEVKSAIMKVEVGESMDIIKTLPVVDKGIDTTGTLDLKINLESRSDNLLSENKISKENTVKNVDSIKTMPALNKNVMENSVTKESLESKDVSKSERNEVFVKSTLLSNIESSVSNQLPKQTTVQKVVTVPRTENSLSKSNSTVQDVKKETINSTEVKKETKLNSTPEEVKTEIISSCEDKMAKLKSLLQGKKKPIKPSEKPSIETNLTSKEDCTSKPELIDGKKGSMSSLIDKPKVATTGNKSTDTQKTTTAVKEENLIEIVKPEKQSGSLTEIKTILKPQSITVSSAIPDTKTIESVSQVTKKTTKLIPIQKPKDKKFKNPHRLTDKRKRCKLHKNIQEDMLFANEIDSGDISDHSPLRPLTLETSSAENSLLSRSLDHTSSESDYFDETKGRFQPSSVDSDDSFQIVFTDSPKVKRRSSDCESEDSFIVFEDSPDSCYTSNDVFGDSESDSDSDSGCDDMCKMSHQMSRTVSDLTDDSLYDERKGDDEIDCAVRSLEVIDDEHVNHGLLITDLKKLRRKELPAKKVRFSEQPPSVRVMRVWAFAARQARAGPWERHALDRERFKRRIADVDMAVSWVLKPQHRSRVMFQRFMPWWNQLKRKELAEKKAEEERRKEEERLRKEEEERKLKEEQELKAQELSKEGQKLIEEQELKEEQQLIEEQQLKEEQHLKEGGNIAETDKKAGDGSAWNENGCIENHCNEIGGNDSRCHENLCHEGNDEIVRTVSIERHRCNEVLRNETIAKVCNDIKQRNQSILDEKDHTSSEKYEKNNIVEKTIKKDAVECNVNENNSKEKVNTIEDGKIQSNVCKSIVPKIYVLSGSDKINKKKNNSTEIKKDLKIAAATQNVPIYHDSVKNGILSNFDIKDNTEKSKVEIVKC